jgi:small neutral amino acid transporter SnatA (MarC family)
VSQWLELSLRFLVILNPFAVIALWTSLSAPLKEGEKARLGVLAGLVGVGCLLVAALAGEWFLDLIDVSAPTWQMGAGLLLILGAVPVFLRRDPFTREPYGGEASVRWWATARMTLNIATPASLAALVYF